MFRYTKYLFANIFAKKGFWITLLISLITLTVVGLFRISDANEHGYSTVRRMDTQSKFLPFIFGVLMTCLVVVYTFKDGVDDGSELMIASKPLHRNRIIIGKFFVLILMIALFQILIFADSFIFAQFDSFASGLARWRYAASLSVGGLIILLIVGSVMSFLAIFLSRIGILALGIVSSAIVPIISEIIAPISKGTPHMLNTVKNRGQYFASTEKMDDFYENVSEIYKEEYDDVDVEKNPYAFNDFLDLGQYVHDDDSEIMLEKMDEQSQKEKSEYFNERWYGSFAKYDVWYQWSGFYDMFMADQQSPYTPFRWELKEEVVNIDKRYSLDPTGKSELSNYFLMFDNRSLANNNFQSKAIMEIEEKIMLNKKVDAYTGEKVKPQFNDADVSLEERLLIMQHMLNDELPALRYDEYFLYRSLVDKLKDEGSYTEPTHVLKSGNDAARTLDEWKKEPSFILRNGDHITRWIGHKYMERSTKVYIWSAIAGAIFLLTIATYLRKDFK